MRLRHVDAAVDAAAPRRTASGTCKRLIARIFAISEAARRDAARAVISGAEHRTEQMARARAGERAHAHA